MADRDDREHPCTLFAEFSSGKKKSYNECVWIPDFRVNSNYVANMHEYDLWQHPTMVWIHILVVEVLVML